jgi:hypothetical protein
MAEGGRVTVDDHNDDINPHIELPAEVFDELVHDLDEPARPAPGLERAVRKRLTPRFDKGPAEVMRALTGDDPDAVRDALAFQRESFRAKYGVYPDDLEPEDFNEEDA